MKRKKFLALALAGVMTAVTLTACAPLEVLYDWFFGGGGSASRGNEKSLVTESVELENKLKAYLDLSETTASARAKETLEEVAKGFDATWLTTNNGLNETAVNALKSITDDKLELTQRLCVDVMELTPSGRTAVMLFPDGDGLGVVSAVVISALPALSLREDFFNLRNFDHCCQRFSACSAAANHFGIFKFRVINYRNMTSISEVIVTRPMTTSISKPSIVFWVSLIKSLDDAFVFGFGYIIPFH